MKHIFIVNPVSGVMDKTEQIRKILSARNDVDTIVFTTEEAGHETELMREMLEIFDDEPVRIVICGGSGTLSNALDAIDVDDMDHVEMGFYPCGLTNDVLKNFADSARHFDDINEIIDGKATNVDYMRCIINGDNRKAQNEILFVTVGIAANIERASRRLKLIGGVSPTFMYVLSTIASMPFSPAVDYEIIIDGKDYSGEYNLVYVGNSPCLGGRFVPIKQEIDCRDGYLNALLLKRIPPFKIIGYLNDFMRGNLNSKRPDEVDVIKCKEISIKRKDGKSMNTNADGEIVSCYSWDMKIVHDKLKLVVPRNAVFAESGEEVIRSLGLN